MFRYSDFSVCNTSASAGALSASKHAIKVARSDLFMICLLINMTHRHGNRAQQQ